ncbi:hypothetical protein [Actinoplanes sp. GCM10030250]|uniref:hypothetical protein n=1 Tax=Actinoplanes sp. GCM10030250 TaxID=3273376 RepID=UPI0036229E2E
MSADQTDDTRAEIRALVRDLLARRKLEPTAFTADDRLALTEKLNRVKARLRDTGLWGLMPDQLRQLAQQEAQWEATAYRTASEIMAKARSAATDVELSARCEAAQITVAAETRAARLLAEAERTAQPPGRNRGRFPGCPGQRTARLSRENLDSKRTTLWPHLVEHLATRVEYNEAVHLAGKTFEIAETRAGTFDSSGQTFLDWIFQIADDVCLDHATATEAHRVVRPEPQFHNVRA